MRPRGMKFLSGEEHLKCTCLADEAGEALGTTPSGDDAEGRSAVSKDGIGGGDADVAGEGKVESAAHTVTVDGSDDWCGKTVDGKHEPLAHEGKFVGARARKSGDLAEVRTGREKSLVAGKDQRADFPGEFFHLRRKAEDSRARLPT